MTTAKSILLARAFCSKQVLLADVVARVREAFATLPLEVAADEESATFGRPGLTIRVGRIDRLRGLLAEAKALPWDAAQARAKKRSCVLRVQVEVGPSYEGKMLTTGRAEMPDVPDEAVGLVEFLSVTPGWDLDVYDHVTNRWLRDPH